MNRSTTMLALGLLLGACGGDPRQDAVTELLRLDEAMHRHAAEHGRFPRTLDPRAPASRSNLPHAAEGEVELSLAGVAADRYSATARSRGWICTASVGPGRRARPDCFPTRGS